MIGCSEALGGRTRLLAHNQRLHPPSVAASVMLASKGQSARRWRVRRGVRRTRVPT